MSLKPFSFLWKIPFYCAEKCKIWKNGIKRHEGLFLLTSCRVKWSLCFKQANYTISYPIVSPFLVSRAALGDENIKYSNYSRFLGEKGIRHLRPRFQPGMLREKHLCRKSTCTSGLRRRKISKKNGRVRGVRPAHVHFFSGALRRMWVITKYILYNSFQIR